MADPHSLDLILNDPGFPPTAAWFILCHVALRGPENIDVCIIPITIHNIGEMLEHIELTERLNHEYDADGLIIQKPSVALDGTRFCNASSLRITFGLGMGTDYVLVNQSQLRSARYDETFPTLWKEWNYDADEVVCAAQTMATTNKCMIHTAAMPIEFLQECRARMQTGKR